MERIGQAADNRLIGRGNHCRGGHRLKRKIERGEYGLWRLLAGMMLVAGLATGGAQAAEPAVGMAGPAAALQRCLGDLAGVKWQWPYLPRMSVSRCISPAGSYKAAAGTATGEERTLAIAAQGGLNHVYADDVMVEESSADLQNAIFLHFDQLLRSQGFAKLAEVRSGATTRGGSYRRQSDEGTVTVVFSADGPGDWSFSFDLAAAPAASGESP